MTTRSKIVVIIAVILIAAVFFGALSIYYNAPSVVKKNNNQAVVNGQTEAVFSYPEEWEGFELVTTDAAYPHYAFENNSDVVVLVHRVLLDDDIELEAYQRQIEASPSADVNFFVNNGQCKFISESDRNVSGLCEIMITDSYTAGYGVVRDEFGQEHAIGIVWPKERSENITRIDFIANQPKPGVTPRDQLSQITTAIELISL